MALINCPECGKQVSDKAEQCPDCGLPINPTNKPKSKPTQNIIVERREGCFLQTLNAGCTVVGIIILLIVIFIISRFA